MVPPNLRFVVDDIESDWTYGSNSFDFIHARFLAASITDYQRLVERCYQSLKPGGWAEFQDWDCYPESEDGSICETNLDYYYSKALEAFKKTGYEVSPGPKLKEWLEKAGFVDVHAVKYTVPYGTWPKDRHLKKVGACNMVQAESSGFEAFAMAAMTRLMGWTKNEVIVLCEQSPHRRQKAQCSYAT